MPRPRFPHMMPEDEPVWLRWLDKHGTEYETYLYDVRVGDGAAVAENYDPTYGRMFSDLTKRRIDVVARRLDVDLIVEVKRTITFTAMGQILSYPVLYTRAGLADRPIAALLVAEEIETDLEPVLHELQISYELV